MLGVFSCKIGESETGRIRFLRARFQTPSSVSFLALTKFRGENSASSSQPIICVPKWTHRVFFRRTHQVCRRTSETVLSKQYSARFLGKTILLTNNRPLAEMCAKLVCKAQLVEPFLNMLMLLFFFFFFLQFSGQRNGTL